MADIGAAVVAESCNHRRPPPRVRPLRPADRTNGVDEAWRLPERLEPQRPPLLLPPNSMTDNTPTSLPANMAVN